MKLLQAFHEADVLDIAPHVRCPTLVMHARDDAIIPFDEGRRVASLIPGARFVPLESRNHVLLESEPAWQHFIDATTEFLPASTAGSSALRNVFISDLTRREHRCWNYSPKVSTTAPSPECCPSVRRPCAIRSPQSLANLASAAERRQ